MQNPTPNFYLVHIAIFYHVICTISSVRSSGNGFQIVGVKPCQCQLPFRPVHITRPTKTPQKGSSTKLPNPKLSSGILLKSSIMSIAEHQKIDTKLVDHPTTLPVEFLIEIVLEFNSRDFIALSHAPRHLRKVFQANASIICNAAVLARYLDVARLLGANLIGGWLTPTFPVPFPILQASGNSHNGYMSVNLGRDFSHSEMVGTGQVT